MRVRKSSLSFIVFIYEMVNIAAMCFLDTHMVWIPLRTKRLWAAENSNSHSLRMVSDHQPTHQRMLLLTDKMLGVTVILVCIILTQS